MAANLLKRNSEVVEVVGLNKSWWEIGDLSQNYLDNNSLLGEARGNALS
jgi:hypothetical protein